MSKPPTKTVPTTKKTGTTSKAGPPEDIEKLKEIAQQLLMVAMQHLEMSGNIKTVIKETVQISLKGLYDIVDRLNDSRLAVKNNLEIVLARRASTSTENPKLLEDINSNLGKLIEEVKTQKEITEKTQHDITNLKEEIKHKQATQQEVQKTEESALKTTPTKTYVEALVEQKPKTTHCLIIGTEDAIDTSEDVITKIKNTINARDSGLQIAKLRKVKDQRVLIGCEKKEDIEQIKDTLEKHNFKVETKENKDPLVILRNVTTSITDREILTAIGKQNPELMDPIPMEQYRMKVRHRRKAKNPEENHVVLQVSPQVWQAMVSAGKLYVEFQRVAVFDLSPLVQCSRCLAFGHGKKWCTESVDLCSHCAGPHLRTECPSLQAGEEPTCKNCQQAKCPRTDHNAFDTHCPVRKKWDALARSSVAYN